MRTAACIAAVIGSTGMGAQALTLRAKSSTVGNHYGWDGSMAHHQRGSSTTGAKALEALTSTLQPSRGVGCDGTRSSERASRGGMSMSATASAPPSWITSDQAPPNRLPDEITAENPLRVVIAGGGVGGLLAAKYMKMQGYDVSATIHVGSRFNVEMRWARFGSKWPVWTSYSPVRDP